jgi:hypothetical protein
MRYYYIKPGRIELPYYTYQMYTLPIELWFVNPLNPHYLSLPKLYYYYIFLNYN